MHNIKKILAIMLISIILITAVGCGNVKDQAGNETVVSAQTNTGLTETGELVVYSSRNEKFTDELLQKFESDTCIKVKALHAGDTVVNKIKEEANNVQADIFISNDIGALEHLRMEGLLKAYDPEGIEDIDVRYRANDNSWVALSARTRVLMYNKYIFFYKEKL